MEFDFAGKDGVEHSEVMLPEGAPAAFRDRQVLWNAAEASEARKDAVPAREILLALPHELDFEQRRASGEGLRRRAHHRARHDRRHRHASTGQGGRPAQLPRPHPGLHAQGHTRTGFGKKEPEWWSPQQVRDWRSGWADIQNAHLRRHLGPDAPQVSHLSLAEQGIDRGPSEHLGPSATAMERRNRRTDRGDRNRDVRARNDTARRDRRDYSDTADRLEASAPTVEAPIDKLVVEATRVRAELVAERDAWSREREALKTPSVARRRGRLNGSCWLRIGRRARGLEAGCSRPKPGSNGPGNGATNCWPGSAIPRG